MVLGEPQILGQVKEAFTVARSVGAVQRRWSGCCRRPLPRQKVRTETQIGSDSVSIASVAVDLAHKIFGSLARQDGVAGGRGQNERIGGAAPGRAGRERDPDFEPDAGPCGASPQHFMGARPFEDLHALADEADILITSTGAAHSSSAASTRSISAPAAQPPDVLISILLCRAM